MKLLSAALALNLTEKNFVSFVGGGGKTSAMFSLAREAALQSARSLITTTTHINLPGHQEYQALYLGADYSWLEKKVTESTGGPIIVAAKGIIKDRKLQGLPPDVISTMTGPYVMVLNEADGSAGLPIKAPKEHEPVLTGMETHVVAVIGADALFEPIEDDLVFRMDNFLHITGARKGDLITHELLYEAAVHSNGFFKNVPESAVPIILINKIDLQDKRKSAFETAWYLKEHLPACRVVLSSFRENHFEAV